MGVENILTLLTVHVDYNKVYACSVVKIFKIKPLKYFKQGGRRRWICLCKHIGANNFMQILSH